MKIGILKETQKGEKRVAISPNIAKQLIEKGFEIASSDTFPQTSTLDITFDSFASTTAVLLISSFHTEGIWGFCDLGFWDSGILTHPLFTVLCAFRRAGFCGLAQSNQLMWQLKIVFVWRGKFPIPANGCRGKPFGFFHK